jgi:hypothetical protein
MQTCKTFLAKSLPMIVWGFDRGVGRPLLLLYDAKALSCLKNKTFKDLGYYSELPKVADAVIKAGLDN